MKITFLGTGTSQGVPVIACPCAVCHSDDPRDSRLRTSALVADAQGGNILIDIGPDFRQQMLRHHVGHLEAILITHAHRDHVGGLDDIRAFNWVQQRKMDLYANSEALATLRRDYAYIFAPHPFPGLPEAELHDVSDGHPFTVGSITVTPIRGMHKDLPVLGFRLDEGASSLAYITDMNRLPDGQREKIAGVDLLVVNALRKEKHFSHFCLPEALALIAQAQPRCALLTHMSHQMGFHAAVDAELPPNVNLAYDNLTIPITPCSI